MNSKQRLTGAAFGVAVLAGGMLSVPSTALAAENTTITKSANLNPIFVGDTVTFTIQVTGSPGVEFQFVDEIADYSGHTTASPAISNLQPSDDGTTLSADVTGTELRVLGVLGTEGTYTLTYSMLVESLGDSSLSSNTCVIPFPPPVNPTEPTRIAPSAGADTPESDSNSTAASLNPVTSNVIEIYDENGDCFPVVIPIQEVPVPPVDPEPEPEPEPEEPNDPVDPTPPPPPSGPEVSEPPLADTENPSDSTVPENAPSTADVSESAVLAKTGADNNFAAAASVAGGLGLVGALMLALRRKFARS